MCNQCGREFFYNVLRVRCFLCKPHPKISNFGVIASLFKQGKSRQDIAGILGVTSSIVGYYLMSFGVHGSDWKFECSQSVSLDLSWFDGWMLGDGYLRLQNDRKNAVAMFTSKHRGYAEYVISCWQSMGLTVPGIREYTREGVGRKLYTNYYTESRAHPVLTDQYRRWYPGGKKKVPFDLRFDPIVLREWYIGDGSIDRRRGVPLLCVGNTQKRQVLFLYKKLSVVFGKGAFTMLKVVPKGLDSRGRKLKIQWRFSFLRFAAKQFFDFIGPCVVPCYQYKWPGGFGF